MTHDQVQEERPRWELLHTVVELCQPTSPFLLLFDNTALRLALKFPFPFYSRTTSIPHTGIV
jgi:hypothetical protein